MRIASFIIGFVTGVVLLTVSGLTLARELMVESATSWIPDFISGESASLTPWWLVVAAGALLVIAASMAFERPLFAFAGYGIAVITTIVAQFTGASLAWIAIIPAMIAMGALLIPPKPWPTPSA